MLAITFALCTWLAAFSYQTDSIMSGFDLNLQHFPYVEPNVPSAFITNDRIEILTGRSKNHPIEFSNGNELYLNSYKEGWDRCLETYLYPSMASWKHSKNQFPWLTNSLPEEFSRDHIAWARHDGYKTCSDRLEIAISSDPNIHGKLLTPHWHRIVFPTILTSAVVAALLFRQWFVGREVGDEDPAQPDRI